MFKVKVKGSNRYSYITIGEFIIRVDRVKTETSIDYLTKQL